MLTWRRFPERPNCTSLGGMPMFNRMRFSSLVIFATVCAATAMAQDQQPQFKARELFYNPIVPARPAAKQEVTAATETNVKVEAPVKHATTPKTKSVKTSKKEEIKTTAASTSTTAASNHPVVTSHQENGVRYQNAALSNSSSIPLAFRYTIQRKSVTGKFEDAAVDATFRSGDRVRVMIESNDNAYLYIVQQGSRKSWNVLFPAPEINGGGNEVKANSKITIPSEYSFSFDDQPGTENVYIVLSRKPEPDFEKLIFALRDKSKMPGDAQAVPVNDQPRFKGNVSQIASSYSNNPLLERLESAMKSRDLVFEKVNEDNEDGRKEKAFYAGTPDTSVNARVVARVELKHE